MNEALPPVRTPLVRRVTAAAVALALAAAPHAQNAPPPPPSQQPGASVPANSLWNQLPAEPDLPGVPRPSDSALRGPEVNGYRGSLLPDLGDSSQIAFSPAQERKVGEQIVRQLRAQGAYMQDPEVNDYLNELGHRLVNAGRDAKQDFEFFAVPDSTINAFALPGGYIGVNTGLIVLAQNESELASVLAHEISHVTQRHMARMIDNQKNSLWMTLAGLALAVLASRAGGGNAHATAAAIQGTQALTIQNQLDFTRENEFEADRIGFQRLVAAGFDPNGAAGLMERLQRSTRFVEGNAPSYLRTHPITYERIAEAQARAQGVPYRQVPDSLDFQLVRALLKSYQGDPRETVASFEDALRQRKYNSEVAERYGLVATLLRGKDIARAKAELAKLERIAPPHPMIEAMAGNVLMGAGEYDAAARRFASALQRYPNKMQLVYDYPESLLQAGRDADAAQFVEKQLARFPGDGPLQLLAARAYAAQNKQMLAHRHQGEYYAWQGNLKGAIEQLEIASKQNDGDFYQASVVDTRLKALKREVADQDKSAFSNSG
jgi:predicted Zn-dependent protease